MIENPTISLIVNFLLLIIPIGAAARVIYCAIGAAVNEADAPMYKKRAGHAIAFAALAEVVVAIITLVMSYYQ